MDSFTGFPFTGMPGAKDIGYGFEEDWPDEIKGIRGMMVCNNHYEMNPDRERAGVAMTVISFHTTSPSLSDYWALRRP